MNWVIHLVVLHSFLNDFEIRHKFIVALSNLEFLGFLLLPVFNTCHSFWDQFLGGRFGSRQASLLNSSRGPAAKSRRTKSTIKRFKAVLDPNTYQKLNPKWAPIGARKWFRSSVQNGFKNAYKLVPKPN